MKVNRLLLTNTSALGAASEEFWQTHPGYVGQQWRELVPLMETGLIDPPSAASMHSTTSPRRCRRSTSGAQPDGYSSASPQPGPARPCRGFGRHRLTRAPHGPAAAFVLVPGGCHGGWWY